MLYIFKKNQKCTSILYSFNKSSNINKWSKYVLLQKVSIIAFKYYASSVGEAGISKNDVLQFLGRGSFHLYICAVDTFPDIQKAVVVSNGENLCWGHINLIYWNLLRNYLIKSLFWVLRIANSRREELDFFNVESDRLVWNGFLFPKK